MQAAIDCPQPLRLGAPDQSPETASVRSLPSLYARGQFARLGCVCGKHDDSLSKLMGDWWPCAECRRYINATWSPSQYVTHVVQCHHIHIVQSLQELLLDVVALINWRKATMS